MNVLIIEDDPDVQLACTQALQLAGMTARSVSNAEDAEKMIARGFDGAVITDMKLPRRDGMEFLRWCHAQQPELPVIMITGHGDVTLAVEAMRNGAYDFLTKPFSSDVLTDVVRRALEKYALQQEVKNLRRTLKIRDGLEAQLLGNSVAITALRRMVTELSDSPVDVLIEGETGTGKELVAQALHNLSARRSHPFVALNCGAMSDSALDSELFGHESGAFSGAVKRRIGKIEHATGGTLFLDEVESMSVAMQVKLLRVLQERKIDRLGSNDTIPVNVRVIAASKEDLLAHSRNGAFRADLYYRLNVAAVHIPPLREHRDDIRLLVEHFLVSAASRFNRPIPVVSPEQMHRLMSHEWPGNVRELKNVADCMVLGLPSVITPAQPDQATAAVAPASLTEMVDGYERDLIAEALSQHNGNAAQAAKTLGVPKTTLAFKIKKYGLSH